MIRALILALVLIPIIEVALFATVGRWLGLWPSLGIVAVTALAGGLIAKRGGARAWRRVAQAMNEGRMPGPELADGVIVLLASSLLIAPGFLTDALGLLLLVPPVRRLARRGLLAYLKRRVQLQMGRWGVGASASSQRSTPPDDGVIDVPGEVMEEERLPPPPDDEPRR